MRMKDLDFFKSPSNTSQRNIPALYPHTCAGIFLSYTLFHH
nr:MAG TPA: hypothetical protein [Caudoviricetes sp.]